VDKEKQLARLMNEEREEGREEGRVEGIDQSRIEGIKSLMNTLTMTAQEAMEALNIPLSEQSRYLSKL
jgi:predicted transposase YdaD